MTSSVVELRQYTLHPGCREELVELFEREFVTGQQECGIRLLGLFRDLRDPDRFVWLRGFPDMPSRGRSLAAFYGGPVWQAHREAANATMIDSDDVLLLRPVRVPPWENTSGPNVYVIVVGPSAAALERAGGEVLACWETEPAANNFPALPVREGENVTVWLARFPALPTDLEVEGQVLLLSPTVASALK